MTRRFPVAAGFWIVLVLLALLPCRMGWAGEGGVYMGSRDCRECHEKFYQLWVPSFHGTAMQSYSDTFARDHLFAQERPLRIGGTAYLAETGPGQGWIRAEGPEGDRSYPIAHVLGGKYVFYFLTPMERGRLQTLPLAYDVDKREWFDMAASGVRHFPGSGEDRPLAWTDPAYTFNTNCYRCHVSQLRLNYDLATRTYNSTWTEPGINCETCHGPSGEHSRVCREAKSQGRVPEDLKIVRGGRDFTPAQNNAACAPCHAKMTPITASFFPGERFFDHYDLAGLENPDFYPDGRDLGENYTYTSWLMSPCVKAGGLDCLHCHTSSGRFRQKADPGASCLPCHTDKAEDLQAHSRHPKGKKSPDCLLCHMPATTFARMRRTDHSMRPPSPAATMEFGSPNACNLCHGDRDAAWANDWVQKWRQRDYQKDVLTLGRLVRAAREGNWSNLEGMLAWISSPTHDPVSRASLARLVGPSRDPRTGPALVGVLGDPEPLVRAAAAEALRYDPPREAIRALLDAAGDEVRLVRVRAAATLATMPVALQGALAPGPEEVLTRAVQELVDSQLARPDLWQSHYNLGNLYLGAGDYSGAVAAYETASSLEAGVAAPLVNAAMAASMAGNGDLAGPLLERALEAESESAAANFNMGLYKAESGDMAGAERHLRRAVRADPSLDRGYYNLSVLVFARDQEEGVQLARKAYGLRPCPDYARRTAELLARAGRVEEAEGLLRLAAVRWPGSAEVRLLLERITLEPGTDSTMSRP